MDTFTEKGGPGSGYFNHAGRPGKRGGSAAISATNSAPKTTNFRSRDKLIEKKMGAVSRWDEVPLRKGAFVTRTYIVTNNDAIIPAEMSHFTLLSNISPEHLGITAEEINKVVEAYQGTQVPDIGEQRNISQDSIVDRFYKNALRNLNWITVSEAGADNDGLADQVTITSSDTDKNTLRRIKKLSDKGVIRLGKRIDWSNHINPVDSFAITYENFWGAREPERYRKDGDRNYASGVKKPWYPSYNTSLKGGPGSGYFGHAGRPGKRGGSAPKDSSSEGAWHAQDIQSKPRGFFPPSHQDKVPLRLIKTDRFEDLPGGRKYMGYWIGKEDGKDVLISDNSRSDYGTESGGFHTLSMAMIIYDLGRYDKLHERAVKVMNDRQKEDKTIEAYGFDNGYIKVRIINDSPRDDKSRIAMIHVRDVNQRTMKRLQRLVDKGFIPSKDITYSIVAEDGSSAMSTDFSPVEFMTASSMIEDGEMITLKGGKGSGYFNHAGRPGKRGGSAPSKSSDVILDKGIRERNFRRWFGKSKVVDKDGNPIVLYHGTPSRPAEMNNRIAASELANDYPNGFPMFDEFKTNTWGSTDSGWLGRGAYFTQDPDYAYEFGDRILPVYIKAENPFEVHDDGSSSYHNLFKFRASLSKLDLPDDLKYLIPNTVLPQRLPWEDEDLSRHVEKGINTKGEKVWQVLVNFDEEDRKLGGGVVESEGKSRDEAISAFNDKHNYDPSQQVSGFILNVISGNIGSHRFTELVRKAGYDSVLERSRWNKDEISEIVVFEPTQIKSVFNTGEFDPDNPKILKEYIYQEMRKARNM